MNFMIWIGIFFCITQSAMFSGLNLACFSISKLKLEIESNRNNPQALKVARLRQDSNFLLTTILWGNVGINVLLTLLSNSVMAGVIAFVFSTVIITFLGEIIPQAYFSRHALKTASYLSPVLRFYQILFYPVAKPTAVVLDKWLGPESIHFFREKEFRDLLKIHMNSDETDIEMIEGKGALNFLAIDDLLVIDEGETVNSDSIIQLTFDEDMPVFPEIERSVKDPFLKSIQSSGKKWIILTDNRDEPKAALDADGFLRSALFDGPQFKPISYCHRPVIIKNENTPLGEILPKLKVLAEHSGDDVIDQDIIVFWGSNRRVITGSDILGRLMRGIVNKRKDYNGKISKYEEKRNWHIPG